MANITEKDVMPVLLKVKRDLEDSGIIPILSEFIERDALAKFSYVSPVALVGVCHSCTAGEIQKEGEVREDFASLIREIQSLSNAMGVGLSENIVEQNLEILDQLAPRGLCLHAERYCCRKTVRGRRTGI